MSITINAPDIEARLCEGANALNVSIEDYTVGVLRATLDALASAAEITPPTLNIHAAVATSAFNPLANLDEDDLEDRRQSAEYLRRTLDETKLVKQAPAHDDKLSRP